MDLTETLFQYSVETKEYGTLYFMIFPDDEKDEAIQKIGEKSNGDDKQFSNLTFDELYLRGTKNTIELAEIDKSKLTDSELNEFAKHFFAKEFCDYKYQPELSWEENIQKANEFQDEKMREETKKLSDSLHMKYDALFALGNTALSSITSLNKNIEHIYEKPQKIVMPELPKIQIPNDYKYEHLLKIESNLHNFADLQVKLGNQLNELVQNLSESVVNLIKINNSLQEQQSESFKKQVEDSKKESKLSFSLSIFAILVSVITLIVSISSSKSTEKITKYYEEQKIELLRDITEQSSLTKNQLTSVLENNTELNDAVLNINTSLNYIIQKQNEIDKQLDTLSKKESDKEK